MANNKRNAEGYADPTAHEAMRKIRRDEIRNTADKMLGLTRRMLEAFGFELTGGVRHIKTGREFR